MRAFRRNIIYKQETCIYISLESNWSAQEAPKYIHLEMQKNNTRARNADMSAYL